MRNSFLNRLDASCSPIESRFVAKHSNSSMKMIDGALDFAIANKTCTKLHQFLQLPRIIWFVLALTNFSDSPRHFETIVLDAMLKNVTRPNVSAQSARAIIVFPTPGAPCINIPRHGRVASLKYSECSRGNRTLS